MFVEMTEVLVTQLSPEWFRLRKETPLTASQFADATGLGQGKPYDFLASLLDDDDQDDHSNSFTQHGITQEPVIDEAYQLLTSNTTKASGLWLPSPDNVLHGLVAASPDRKVMNAAHEMIGLCEYKAPVYCLYNSEKHPNGIPRKYMVQIQGQMAVCKAAWCDFMAVCTKTKEICLKRVFFCDSYWKAVAEKLKQFIVVFQEAQHRKRDGLSSWLDFPAAQQLQNISLPVDLLPGEKDIKVIDNLCRDHRNRYQHQGGPWVHYDILMGDIMTTGTTCSQEILRKVDQEIGLNREQVS